MRKFVTSLFALTMVWALAGCNTLAGVGKDIAKAGEKIEDVAKKNK